MAFDGKLAVQVGALGALEASPLPGNAPVFQNVPDEQQPPLVVIDKITLTAAGGKDGGLDQAELHIVTLVREGGREFLTPVMAEIRARLEDQVLTAAGAELSRPVFASDDDGLLDDGETYFGTQVFSLFVQPSD